MARNPYDPVPDISPEPTAPDAYSRVTPTGFQGVAKLGAGITQAADFYSQAAVDDGHNQLQQFGTSLLYGSTTTGAQGQTAQVPGYLSLNGKAALEQRPDVQAKLDDKINELSKGFATPEMQQAFKTRAAAYRAGFSSQVGSHSQTESTQWFKSVNDATAINQLDLIAANTDFNPKTFAEATITLTNARMKTAQLAGASPGDEVWNASLRSAKQEATKAQALALNTKDPNKALDFIEANKGTLGTEYDNLYASIRSGAIATEGDAMATTALSDRAATGTPLVRVPSPAGQPAWLDAYLGNIKAQESGGSATAKSSTSSATGLYQFITSTWHGLMRAHPDAGLTENGRTDPAQQERAVRAFTADNAKLLTANRVLITPGNLYLAAFFGPAGAAHVYDQPAGTPMEQAVSEDVLRANKWLRGKTVGDIRNWAGGIAGRGIDPTAGGVGGTAPVPSPVDVGHPDVVGQAAPVVPPPQAAIIAAPVAPVPEDLTVDTTPTGSASAKAAVIQNIIDAPDADLIAKYGIDGARQVKQHAIAAATQQLSAMQVAADQTAAQKRAANEKAADGYVTQILTPGADYTKLLPQIANDPNLTSETKLSLSNAVAAHADGTVQGDMAKYGPAYFDVMKRIIAEPGNPLRISDPTEILQMAAPGPYGEAPKLTLPGAQSLIQQMAISNKSPADASVTRAMVGLTNYAKLKLSYEQDVGPLQIKDPVGEQIFTGQFIPKFEKAYSDWIAAGKAPFDFLNPETVDKLIAGMRNPHQMAIEKLQAMSGIDTSTLTAPPAPTGVDNDGWKLAVNSPPKLPNGQVVPPDKWAQAVTILSQEPTAERMGQFDQVFGQSGVTAANLLDVLGVTPHEPTDDEKRRAASAAGYAVINGVVDTGLPMPRGQ